MYKIIPLALLLTAVPAMVRAQTTPIVEISANHGHTFTLEGNSQSRIVKAWPGAFEAFDFGEHPKIPNAKFIFVKLKPGAKLDSTTLTLIIDDGTGKEVTKAFVLKRVSGIPARTTTLIGNQPVVAAQPQPVQPVITPQVYSPPPRPVRQVNQEKKARKPRKLKVSKEFSSVFASGFASSKAVEPDPKQKAEVKPSETDREESEETQDAQPLNKSEPKGTEDAAKVKSDTSQLPAQSKRGGLPLIRAPKTLQAKASVETPEEKRLIDRSSLNNYAIAHHLLRGLYRAERLKQINPSKPQFGQAQSTAIWLRRGRTIEEALRRSRLPRETFDNLLGHGGVGK